jgi:hypothetical protein
MPNYETARTASSLETKAPRRRGRRAALALLAAGAGFGAVSANRWQLRWGATPAEEGRPLPGDALVPMPRLEATRAIGVDAPPVAVWPWIAQLGWGRGGFYSYDWLENLFGLGIHSAPAVMPGFQGITKGQAVHLAEPVALVAAVVEPDRALVLFGDGLDGGPGFGFAFSWAFTLEPEGPLGTRLVVRERYSWDSPAVGAGIRAVSLVSFAMTQKMLRGIRDRAEGASPDGSMSPSFHESVADYPKEPQ